MKLSIRVIFGMALLAGCTSAPVALDHPLVVAFEWKPAEADVALDVASQQVLAQRSSAVRLYFKNHFDTRFGDVTFVPAAATARHSNRVELTVAELARQRVDVSQLASSSDQQTRDPNAANERCGSVEYVVFVDDRESRRGSFPLNCASRQDALPGTHDRAFADQRGFADYTTAAVRAANEVARALKTAS